MSLPSSLDVTALAQRCSQENDLFRRVGASDPAYCLELWRRALRGGAEAWQQAVECFTTNVRMWLYRHPRRWCAMRYRDERSLVDETFSRFAEVSLKHTLEFATLPQLLTYIHRCLHATVLAECRERRDISIERDAFTHPRGANPEQIILHTTEAVTLWVNMQRCTSSARERRLIELRWLQGFPPREIVSRFGDEFSDVRKVSQTLANILARYYRRYGRP
jgi:DNA-directed RNA polymerase specialized sigma24 family protein